MAKPDQQNKPDENTGATKVLPGWTLTLNVARADFAPLMRAVKSAIADLGWDHKSVIDKVDMASSENSVVLAAGSHDRMLLLAEKLKSALKTEKVQLLEDVAAIEWAYPIGGKDMTMNARFIPAAGFGFGAEGMSGIPYKESFVLELTRTGANKRLLDYLWAHEDVDTVVGLTEAIADESALRRREDALRQSHEILVAQYGAFYLGAGGDKEKAAWADWIYDPRLRPDWEARKIEALQQKIKDMKNVVPKPTPDEPEAQQSPPEWPQPDEPLPSEPAQPEEPPPPQPPQPEEPPPSEPPQESPYDPADLARNRLRGAWEVFSARKNFWNAVVETAAARRDFHARRRDYARGVSATITEAFDRIQTIRSLLTVMQDDFANPAHIAHERRLVDEIDKAVRVAGDKAVVPGKTINDQTRVLWDQYAAHVRKGDVEAAAASLKSMKNLRFEKNITAVEKDAFAASVDVVQDRLVDFAIQKKKAIAAHAGFDPAENVRIHHIASIIEAAGPYADRIRTPHIAALAGKHKALPEIAILKAGLDADGKPDLNAIYEAFVKGGSRFNPASLLPLLDDIRRPFAKRQARLDAVAVREDQRAAAVDLYGRAATDAAAVEMKRAEDGSDFVEQFVALASALPHTEQQDVEDILEEAVQKTAAWMDAGAVLDGLRKPRTTTFNPRAESERLHAQFVEAVTGIPPEKPRSGFIARIKGRIPGLS